MGFFTVNVRGLIKTSKHCLIFDSFFIESCGKDKTSCISFLLVYMGFFTVNVRGLIKTSKHCLIFDSFLLKALLKHQNIVERQDIFYQLSPCIYGFPYVNVRGLIKISIHCLIFDSFLLTVVDKARHLVSAFSLYIWVSLRSMFEALLKHQNIA